MNAEPITIHSPEFLNYEHLAARALVLDEKIKNLQQQSRQIKAQLAERAFFKEGSHTGHLETVNYRIKVQRRELVKWNQDLLNTVVRPALGEAKFFQLFDWEFKPRAKELNGFLSHGDPALYGLIIDSRTVASGAPHVTFELKESC